MSAQSTIIYVIPIISLLAIIGILGFVLVVGKKKQPNTTGITASTGERIILTLLGFFCPVVGIILFLVWRNSRPEFAEPIAYGIKVYFVIMLVLAVVAILSSILIN